MAKAISHSGSLTTDGTEQTIGAAYTDHLMRQLWLDTSAMVNGDQFRVRAKVTINGVASLIYREWLLSDVQAEPAVLVPGITNYSSLTFTIQRISATNRAFGYQVETLES